MDLSKCSEKSVHS